jgi:plastocyanin
MIRRPILVLCLLCVGLTATSCGNSYDTPTSPATQIPPGATTVLVPAGTAGTSAGPGYAPTPLTVAVGTTVTWGNNDATTHTTTSDAAGWNLTVNPGATATFKFDKVGTYAYHCTIHPFMKGTVVVQ